MNRLYSRPAGFVNIALTNAGAIDYSMQTMEKTDWKTEQADNTGGQAAAAKARLRTGLFASGTGILCNLALFAGKFAAGLFSHSISITSDAFNNLSDAASSVVSFVGVKVAGQPSDREHPFGHGRMEQIAALIVAFLIFVVGARLLTESIGRVRDPRPLEYHPVILAVLLVAIAVKIWLFFFYRRTGKRIQSEVLLAAGTDSASDVAVTSVTLVSLILAKVSGILIDGWAGIAVSVFVFWSGFSVARDAVRVLIGMRADPEIEEKIRAVVMRFPKIRGTHDLMVHSYGPGKYYASIHAEIAGSESVEAAHRACDEAEEAVFSELGVQLVIHMDPVNTDAETARVKALLEEELAAAGEGCSIHDFHRTEGNNYSFDLAVPYGMTKEREQEIVDRLLARVREDGAEITCRIHVENA